jgi:hypothetical protein
LEAREASGNETREFITLLGGTIAAWRSGARAAADDAGD